jgi:hypothetical protein
VRIHSCLPTAAWPLSAMLSAIVLTCSCSPSRNEIAPAHPEGPYRPPIVTPSAPLHQGPPVTADASSRPLARSTPLPVRQPDVIYVPTPLRVVDKMLELAKPQKTDVLYDLWCVAGSAARTIAPLAGGPNG